MILLNFWLLRLFCQKNKVKIRLAFANAKTFDDFWLRLCRDRFFVVKLGKTDCGKT